MAQVFDSSLSVRGKLSFRCRSCLLVKCTLVLPSLVKSSEAQVFPEEKLPLTVRSILLLPERQGGILHVQPYVAYRRSSNHWGKLLPSCQINYCFLQILFIWRELIGSTARSLGVCCICLLSIHGILIYMVLVAVVGSSKSTQEIIPGS